MEQSPLAAALLTAALAVIMLALGTTLRGEQFRLVFTQPRGVLVGLLNLLVVAPALAYGVAELTGLDPLLAAGLMLLGAAPGGVFANLLTHLARGATALSISMTAISSTLAVVTVPIWLGVAFATFDVPSDVELDMGPIVARVLIGIAVPLAAGMWLAARRPQWVEHHRRRLERVAVATFAVVVVVAIASQTGPVLDNLGELIVATVLLNVLAMTIGFAAARAARLDAPQATAIAMELGIHNAALAVAIGAAVDERLALPASVYSAVMVVTGGLFAAFMARRGRVAAAAA
ncbi:MAG: bile acid:sodium symporter [Solirubrobacteraceae bacterium]|nr:bile acid:sodium symporter [Solirubrobacteraceae bacterium]